MLAVDMSLAEHWKYVEYDTKPHWAPRDKILDWIKVKPVLPTPNENGKVPTPGQLAFLIQRKIANEGTKGSHDLENSVSALNEYYAQRIADAVAEDFGDSVDVVLKSFASF